MLKKGTVEVKSLGDYLPVLKAAFPNVTTAIGQFTGALGGAAGKGGLAKAAAGAGGALKGLWTIVLNHPIAAAVAVAGLAIAAFAKWGESAEELAERVDEVTSRYKEQSEALKKIQGDYDLSDSGSMVNRYEELSKGVNELGENVALTSDEYAEYQNIVNTIANQIPGLVTGYNSQGDAMLDCAGSAEELAKAYKELAIAQNEELLDTGEDVFKKFENDLKKSDAYHKASKEINTEYLDGLKEIFSAEDEVGDIKEIVDKMSQAEKEQVSAILEESGIERDTFGKDVLGEGFTHIESYGEHITRAIEENKAQVKKILDEASADLNEYAEELGLVTGAYFDTAFLGGTWEIGDYSHMSEKMQGIIKQVTSGFDADFYADFLKKDNPYEALSEYLESILSAFDSLSENEKAEFEAAFDLKTKFNSGEISYGEYVSGIQDAAELVDGLGLDKDVEAQIKLSLGLSEKDGKWELEEYEALLTRLTSEEYHIKMKADEAEEFLESLTNNEHAVLVDLVMSGEVDLSKFNIDQLRKYIKEKAKLNEAMNFTIAMDVETQGVETLNTAMAESVSATGLSSEAISALKARYSELESEGYNLSAMFEETSHGIHLNREAVDEFEKAIASKKLSETEGHLEVLKGRYDDLTEQINNCTDASERAALYTEQKQIVEKINDLATLASQYEGLTSAYNAWQSAESAGSERDMYESIISGFETVKDEISRGWYDDGTIKFLELMTGQTDLAGKSASELKEIWNSLDDTIKGTSYSVKDFFTTDDEGNSTNTGVYNFLRAIKELKSNGTLKAIEGQNIEDLITTKDGKITAFNFEVVGGDKAIAEALGISEELVQIMLRAADDAGFVVNLEGTYTQLADLKTEAESARDTLISLKKDGLEALKDVDVNFNLEAQGDDLVSEQEKAVKLLDKFKKDGKIDLEMEGAQEALDIAEYLTIKLDDLTEPKFMQIDTSDLDEEVREPIEKIQEIGRLCKEKHLVTLTGDTEDLKEVQDEIDTVAKEIEELDPEVKAKVGIDDSWTADEIADKIEKGEIEIPAELELDVQMSEDLKDMRLMMMKQLGLVDDNEVKLKIGYDIDDSEVDKLTEDEREVLVTFITENEDWFNELSGDEKEIVIDLVASGVDLETLTDDEKKEVVIEFVTKNEEEFDKLTDEEKEVVVDIITDDEALKSLEEHQVEIEAFAKVFGVETVDDLAKKLEGLDDKQIQVLTKVLGQIDVEKLQKTVAGLDDKTVQAIAKAIGEGDVDGLKTVINGLDDKTVQAIAQALGYGDVNELNTAIDNLDPKTVQAIAQALGITDVDSLRAAINRLTDKDVDAVANVSGEDDVNSLQTAIDNLKGKTITVWASIQKKASSLWGKLTGGGDEGGSDVNGTANVNGTAFAGGTIQRSGRAFKRGNWGTKNSGTALVGELGREVLIRGGRYYTVGDYGAEFIKYKKGDIILNHVQSEQLFKNGHVTADGGRAKSFAGGSAFVSGTAFSTGSSGSGGGEEYVVVGTNKSTGKKYTKSTDDAKDDFQEIFDLIEIAIDRIERDIDRLDTKASSVYRSWGERNSALVQQIGKVREEINLQERAYDEYMKAASATGLPSDWVKKIQNGEIDIETVTDEVLAEKISDYEDWYEKALDVKDAILDLQEEESKLIQQKFDNILDRYDGYLSVIEHEKNMLEEYMNQSEAQNWLVSSKYYDALINSERDNISMLEQQKAELLSQLGPYEDTAQWYENVAAIDEITLAIEEANTSILEWQQNVQELEWDKFDLLQEKISAVTEEADFLIELLSSDKLFDDRGQLTDEGLSTVGLHGQNYNTNMYQADITREEAERLKKLMESSTSDEYDRELEERYREMIAQQQEFILAAEQEKQAIVDLVEEGISLEIDALEERIDAYNKNLDAAKDLYEYNKRVEEQTKNIASLRKQLSSMENDDSEETKARVQKLRIELAEAESELEETQYDRYIEDQQKMLDDLLLSYEETLNSRLDNIDALIGDMILNINENAGTISGTIDEVTRAVGYETSESLKTVWDKNTAMTNGVLELYGKNFTNKQHTANLALDAIKVNTQNMISKLDSLAQEKAKSAAGSSAANPPKTNTGSNNNKKNDDKKQETKEDDKREITDDTLMGIASAIWVYGKNSGWGNNPFRENKLSDKIGSANAKKVQSYINQYGSSGKLYDFWIKKKKNLDAYKYSAFKTGKKNIDFDQLAWTQENGQEFIIRPSDGAILTPLAKSDSVLNATASNNLWNVANNPAEFIKDSLSLGSANVPESGSHNEIVQNFDQISFVLPNVRNYDQMLSQMQKDKNFERLISSMTIDQMAGKSSLAKGKAIR